MTFFDIILVHRITQKVVDKMFKNILRKMGLG